MVRNPAGPLDSGRRKGSVTLPVGICGIQLGFDGCHLWVYAVSEAVMVGGLVAGNTDILEPTAQQFLIADTGLVRHDSQLQGQPAFDGRVSTLVEDLLEMLKLWQLRSFIFPGYAGNRTLMLFGAESRQTCRLKVTEWTRCFGKFSSHIAFEKDLDADDAIEDDVT